MNRHTDYTLNFKTDIFWDVIFQKNKLLLFQWTTKRLQIILNILHSIRAFIHLVVRMALLGIFIGGNIYYSHNSRVTVLKYARYNHWSCSSTPALCLHSVDRSLTYLLTPWCRVLLEKLTGLQLVKKFPAFYGTRRFITALTSVRHLSLPGPAQSNPHTHIPPPGDPA